MTNSDAETIQMPCPTINQVFSFGAWLIMDTIEKPNLVAKIRKNNLHEVIHKMCEGVY